MKREQPKPDSHDLVIAETPRLVLRQFQRDDGEAMNLVFGDPEVMRYGDGVRSRQWVRSWIAAWIDQHYGQWGFGVWAVVDKGTSAAIGYCGLSRFAGRCADDETEIGFRLGRAHWGRGLATEAAVATRDYAFEGLGLPRLVAMVDPANGASIRVVTKIGMRHERDVMLPGYDHPDHLYTLNRPSDPRPA